MKEHDANANAIIFARAGCGDQNGQSYVQEQLERCRQFALSHDLNVQHEFSCPGIAAWQGFDTLLRFLQQHPDCRHLIVEKIDRLIRNLGDFTALERLPIKIHFVEEESLDAEPATTRRAPGVAAKNIGKRLKRGAATQVMLYPRLAAKSAIVAGSRAAKLPLSSFCIRAALKETAFVLGCSINDLIPEEELRIYSRRRF
jgi:hypothetical protein